MMRTSENGPCSMGSVSGQVRQRAYCARSGSMLAAACLLLGAPTLLSACATAPASEPAPITQTAKKDGYKPGKQYSYWSLIPVLPGPAKLAGVELPTTLEGGQTILKQRGFKFPAVPTDGQNFDDGDFRLLRMHSAVPGSDKVHAIVINDIEVAGAPDDVETVRTRYYTDYGPAGLSLFERRVEGTKGRTGRATREIFEWDHDDIRVTNDRVDGQEQMPWRARTSQCGKAVRALLDAAGDPVEWVAVDDIRNYRLRIGENRIPIDANCGTVVEQTIVYETNPETGRQEVMTHSIAILDHVSAHAALTGG